MNKGKLLLLTALWSIFKVVLVIVGFVFCGIALNIPLDTCAIFACGVVCIFIGLTATINLKFE